MVVASRGTPTQLTYSNKLGHTSTSKVAAYTTSTDQSLHWADPLNAEQNACSMALATLVPPAALPPECYLNYSGPIPAAVHIHGGEVPPDLDGGPDAWFTSQLGANNAATQTFTGHGYYTREVADIAASPVLAAGTLVKDQVSGGYFQSNGTSWVPTSDLGRATYVYPNVQEAANIWFHDHTLGATRLNVYAGIAGAYVMVDPNQATAPNAALQNPLELVPLVLQDRMFDTAGQLYFPNAGINPNEHKFWIPEFLGDVIVVNGKAWPYLNVEQKKYRFLFLNGSNARGYELYLSKNALGTIPGPAMWVVGTDGGFLDAPVKIELKVPQANLATAPVGDKLVILPGERYEVVIDFSALPVGTVLEMKNTAPAPYPFGAPVDRRTNGRIMQFKVVAAGGAPNITPTAYEPDATKATYSGSPRASNPIVRLDPIVPNVTRQLTLNEVMGPGGPWEILLNNTKWDGTYVDGTNTVTPRPDFQLVNVNGVPAYYSELPQEGTTEIWEIVNMTADAHPIHLHLTQFQILGRQAFNNLTCYEPTYLGSFPAGAKIEGFGPPFPYNSTVKLGGNPDVYATTCMVGVEEPPLPSERGWKDTAVMYPDQVTRIAVRWAPGDLPNTYTYAANADKLGYAFDPNHGHGYVWHCHIIDHEDNEMMRPMQVNTNPSIPSRSFVKGTDY